MSHHLDSPIARQDVRLDITDLYCFRGETGTVFVINVCHSIAGDIPVPGYHPKGMYEFKIDLDGDAVEDLTYRFIFDERDAAGKQRFVLRRIAGAEAADPARLVWSSRRVPPRKPSTRRPAFVFGLARRTIRSGSSPTYCMRSGTRSRTAPLLIYPVGIQARPESYLPVTACIRLCWRLLTQTCSQALATTAVSVCGPLRRSLQRPEDGA